jgi:Na+-transporting NADH:ubiquinone oxidoreductase subunit C
MRSFSNTYIFVFSLIMVTIVAVLLSFVSMQLKPRQEMNVEIEKKQAILTTVGVSGDATEAADKNTFINEEFAKFITDSYVVSYDGKKLDADAFEVTLDLANEIRKPREDREYPIFVYTGENGSKRYVVPVRGKGLWGPIWGYIALESDLNTIAGAVYDHKGETPGLGAQIATDGFESEFDGKTIFNDAGEFVSVMVVKGGADPSDPHGVDAISGGTITSKGLEAMLVDCLTGYVAYFKELSNN